MTSFFAFVLLVYGAYLNLAYYVYLIVLNIIYLLVRHPGNIDDSVSMPGVIGTSHYYCTTGSQHEEG